MVQLSVLENKVFEARAMVFQKYLLQIPNYNWTIKAEIQQSGTLISPTAISHSFRQMDAGIGNQIDLVVYAITRTSTINLILSKALGRERRCVAPDTAECR